MSPSAGAPDSVSTRNSLPSRSRTNGVEHCGFAQWLSIRGLRQNLLASRACRIPDGISVFCSNFFYWRREFEWALLPKSGTIADMSSVVA
jgi:hypothetical protein